jgi:GAF domain-containing protein/ABC-type transporter Mla MlaB component
MAGGNQAAKTLPFYRCLVLFALPPAASPEEAERRAELIGKHRQQLDVLAACAPMNFQHMKVLIDAEAARSAGDIGQAIRLYEQALTLAGENKSAYVEAIAGELCARFYLSLGLVKGARAYMRDACRAYLHWGATGKAEALQAEYAQVWPTLRREKAEKTPGVSSSSEGSSTTNTGGSILSRTSLGSLRDAALILRAAQAISSEVDLPRVIERLAALVLENAGAERGALILSREGQLFVEATFGMHESAAEVGQGQPLDDTEGIARSVVFYVVRTQDPVVLDNAGATTRFSDDPYVRSGKPKSILCIPLLHQARLSGILYLENTVTSSVFNAARVELLALLSSQAAIAIENARLIASVRAASAETRRINERLELEVANRTDELRGANKDLFTINERLESELAQRGEVEQERMALKEQVIAAQRDRLTEMSTPLIPITDDIMVMPLIGTVDRDRATQVLTVALEGAQRHRARVVILDITGIKQIDTHVAGTLIGVAGALRMLGTHTVLTGIAPDIARTLVNLDVDLGSFVTLGTLQSGIAYALKRVRSAGLPGATGKRA